MGKLLILLLSVVVLAPISVFYIIREIINLQYFESQFLNDNMLLFYGTIIGSCLSGCITLVALLITFKVNNKNIKKGEDDFKKKELINNITNAIFILYELKSAVHKSTCYSISCKKNPIVNLMPNDYSNKIYFLREKVIFYIENINNQYTSKYKLGLFAHLENLNIETNNYFKDYNSDAMEGTDKLNVNYIPEIMNDIDIFIYDLKMIKYENC